jgi:hypothetical protein
MTTHPDDKDLLNPDDPAHQRRQTDAEIQANRYKHLEGRLYVHPVTKHLHEVMYVFWDIIEKKVGAYRRTLPDDVHEPDDLYPYEVEGPNGVAALVLEYEKSPDRATHTTWPSCEAEMKRLQLQDPSLKTYIEAIEVGLDRKIRGKRLRTPTVAGGNKGALRVDYFEPLLRELKTVEKRGEGDCTPTRDSGGDNSDDDQAQYLPEERQWAEEDPFYHRRREKRFARREWPEKSIQRPTRPGNP